MAHNNNIWYLPHHPSKFPTVLIATEYPGTLLGERLDRILEKVDKIGNSSIPEDGTIGEPFDKKRTKLSEFLKQIEI